MEQLKMIGMANRFKNVELWILDEAYDRGHSAGEDEVNSIAMSIRTELYEAIEKDLLED